MFFLQLIFCRVTNKKLEQYVFDNFFLVREKVVHRAKFVHVIRYQRR